MEILQTERPGMTGTLMMVDHTSMWMHHIQVQEYMEILQQPRQTGEEEGLTDTLVELRDTRIHDMKTWHKERALPNITIIPAWSKADKVIAPVEIKVMGAERLTRTEVAVIQLAVDRENRVRHQTP